MLSLLEHMYHELQIVKEFNMNPITLKRWLVRPRINASLCYLIITKCFSCLQSFDTVGWKDIRLVKVSCYRSLSGNQLTHVNEKISDKTVGRVTVTFADKIGLV